MEIKVLGTGCANCHNLETRTQEALVQLGVTGDVEMVTDYAQIAGYGVMNTPAVVVDEKVLLSGRVPEVDEFVSEVAKVGEISAVARSGSVAVSKGEVTLSSYDQHHHLSA